MNRNFIFSGPDPYADIKKKIVRTPAEIRTWAELNKNRGLAEASDDDTLMDYVSVMLVSREIYSVPVYDQKGENFLDWLIGKRANP